jgi:histidine triad (HIT) family protein
VTAEGPPVPHPGGTSSASSVTARSIPAGDQHVELSCVFCRICQDSYREEGSPPHPQLGTLRYAKHEQTLILADWGDTIAFPPLNPVTPGHILVVPRDHVGHLGIAWDVTGRTFERASELAWRLYLSRGVGVNLITSAGKAATQTVFHLHVHVIPRRIDDGLKLPWSDGDG